MLQVGNTGRGIPPGCRFSLGLLFLFWLLPPGLLCARPAAAGEVGDEARLAVSVPLKPAFDRGLKVTRVTASLVRADQSISLDLGMADSLRTAGGIITGLRPGPYLVQIEAYNGPAAVGGGAGRIEVATRPAKVSPMQVTTGTPTHKASLAVVWAL